MNVWYILKEILQIKCKSSHFHRSHLRLKEEKLTVLHVSFSYVCLFLHCMQYLLFCCFSLWVVLRKQWRKLWLCWVVKCHYCDTSMFLYVEWGYRETGLACKLVWRIITHLNASCCMGVFESNTWWTAVLFTSWVTVLGFLTLTQLLNSYSAFVAVSLVLKYERIVCLWGVGRPAAVVHTLLRTNLTQLSRRQLQPYLTTTAHRCTLHDDISCEQRGWPDGNRPLWTLAPPPSLCHRLAYWAAVCGCCSTKKWTQSQIGRPRKDRTACCCVWWSLSCQSQSWDMRGMCITSGSVQPGREEGSRDAPLLTFSSEKVLMVRRGKSQNYTATHNTLDLHHYKAASSSLSSLKRTECNGVHLLFHY